MTNVFTYGSLMFEPVWTCVVAGDYHSRPAKIHEYKRYAVIDQDFPVVVPGDKADTLNGVLYLNISDDDLARLDEFESYFYFRKTVKIFGEKNIRADVYVLDPAHSSIASDKAWDLDEFERTGIAKFIKRFS